MTSADHTIAPANAILGIVSNSMIDNLTCLYISSPPLVLSHLSPVWTRRIGQPVKVLHIRRFPLGTTSRSTHLDLAPLFACVQCYRRTVDGQPATVLFIVYRTPATVPRRSDAHLSAVLDDQGAAYGDVKVGVAHVVHANLLCFREEAQPVISLFSPEQLSLISQ